MPQDLPMSTRRRALLPELSDIANTSVTVPELPKLTAQTENVVNA